MKETFQPKRLLAGILSVILAISLFPSVVFASEPDLILSTYSQFEQFASDVNNGTSYEGKTVRLDVNIDLGGADNPWTPIGSSSNPFKGTFDGNYHTVEGLYINSTGGSKLGLFGQVTGGTVKNLGVGGEVTGSSSVAGVVGSTSDATVTNCGYGQLGRRRCRRIRRRRNDGQRLLQYRCGFRNHRLYRRCNRSALARRHRGKLL